MNKVLKYNSSLEYALRCIGYKKYEGYASSFKEPKYFKEGLIDWIGKAKKRLIELTEYDDRLREIGLIYLQSIEREVKKIDKENNEVIIIAKLIHLINNLLGYDYDGVINRNVLFYQDQNHHYINEKNRGNIDAKKELNFIINFKKYQKKLVDVLIKENLKEHQITEILKISSYKLRKLKEMK